MNRKLYSAKDCQRIILSEIGEMQDVLAKSSGESRNGADDSMDVCKDGVCAVTWKPQRPAR